MGALRETVREPVFRRVVRKRARAGGSSAVLKKSRVAPKVSKDVSLQVATALKYMRAKLVAAHPGEVRLQTFTNEELRNSGLGHLADLNEALGVKES